jgi:hypothetical protein
MMNVNEFSLLIYLLTHKKEYTYIHTYIHTDAYSGINKW